MGLRGRELTVRREKAAQPAGFLVGDDAVPQDHAAQDLEQEAVEIRVDPVGRALEVHQEGRLFAIDRAVREDRPLQQVGLALVDAAIVQQEFLDKRWPVHRTPLSVNYPGARRACSAKSAGSSFAGGAIAQRPHAATSSVPSASPAVDGSVSGWEADAAVCAWLVEASSRCAR